MQSHSSVLAFGIGIAILIGTLALLGGGFVIGRELATMLDRPGAMIFSLFLSLLPAAALLLTRRHPSMGRLLFIAGMVFLVGSITFNLHAAVWVDGLRRASMGRLLALVSALVWPLLTAGASALLISPDRALSKRAATHVVAGTASLGLQMLLAWGLFHLFAGSPSTAFILLIAASVVLAHYLIQSESAYWWLKRSHTAVPAAVRDVFEDIRSRTQARIDDLLLVSRGSDFVAEVRTRPFRLPVLVLSDRFAQELDSRTLAAVLAHEMAHVKLGHLQQRVWTSIALTAILVIAFMWMLPGDRVPADWRAAYSMVVVTIGLIVRKALLDTVARIQERQADKFAAEIVGPDVFREALHKTLGNTGIPADMSTSPMHDSLASRLRALEHG